MNLEKSGICPRKYPNLQIHPILAFSETEGLRTLSSLPSRECKFYSIEQFFTGGREVSGTHLALNWPKFFIHITHCGKLKKLSYSLLSKYIWSKGRIFLNLNQYFYSLCTQVRNTVLMTSFKFIIYYLI